MFLSFSIRTFYFVSLISSCLSDFHPLYQAMLGDPTLRVHSMIYGSADVGSKRNYTGLFVYPNFPGPFNAVIVAPDADGRNSFEDGKAISLARQGYAALAADMRIVSENADGDNDVDTRKILLDQYLLAYQEIRRLPFVNKIAAIGYGIGGLTILDALRLNAVNITAAVCVHAILRPSKLSTSPLTNSTPPRIDTKLLILDGWRDPLNPKETVDEVLQELDRLDIDWQMHRFSHAKHAFTIPLADVENITQYNAQAAQYAWIETLMFLDSTMRQ